MTGALLGASLVLILSGCVDYLSSYERDIKDSTRVIETARDDVQRAKGYTKRGSAYSEKARYSRAMKLIPADEYGRLFDLALKDHEQAIALNPASAEVYLNRGQAYYDRATLDLQDHKNPKPWFDPAAADFEKSTEKDPQNYHAFDMLGLAYEQNDQFEEAIDAYTKERALNSLGKVRLSDAYCTWGMKHQKEKNDSAAAVAYQKSVEIGTRADDGCSCDPYFPLIMIYTEQKEYDKAHEVIRLARTSNRWIDPEVIERLKKESGHKN
ncbi:MAG TPA: tetratricopeptide repeat protein [Bryobacteraceae bacterium]